MQKITMVIPTYWGPSEDKDIEEEKVFDHPTPLNQEGTLGRVLESLNVLERSDFSIVLIVASTSSKIEKEVVSKVKEISRSFREKYDLKLLHHENLKSLRGKLLSKNVIPDACSLINLDNYSSIRNTCSIAGILDGSDLVVFIDDDEVFKDSNFIDKAVEHVGKERDGEKILAVAGYYINSDGNYKLDETGVPFWKRESWNNVIAMNQAFDQIIGKRPRLKLTPFVFGGNMVIHRELLVSVPFDPAITRGEDIDFLINVRISGKKFWLDNALSIVHRPPSKKSPQWLSFREDIKRFLYEKKKVNDHNHIKEVSRNALMPYPGLFVGEDLEDRIFKANKLLYREYEEAGGRYEMEQCDINEEIVKSGKLRDIDTRTWLERLTSNWRILTRAAAGVGISD